MSQGDIVRKPLRVRQRSSRTLGERLSLRFPSLVHASARLISRLPPSSSVRPAVMWRGARQRMDAFNRRDIDAALIGSAPDFEYRPAREFVDMALWRRAIAARRACASTCRLGLMSGVPVFVRSQLNWST